jgi:hypothetical protein
VTKIRYLLLPCATLMALAPTGHSQVLTQPRESGGISGIPVITGFMSYQSNIAPGTFDLNPEFDPVLLVPIGNKTLLSSEFDMSLDVSHTDGSWGPAAVDHGFDYLQVSHNISSNLTAVAGRYLVPFGIYRERMHPLWIRYLQQEPISFTLNATSGNGGMLRGGAHLGSYANVEYSGYYSAATSTMIVQSDKQAGFRCSLVLPEKRIEIGSSFNDTMGAGAHKMVGTDFTWLLKRVPLDIRSETLFSKQAGNTYWVEGAYKLSQLGRSSFLKYTSIVYRQEQYWLPKGAMNLSAMTGTMGSLPDTNTARSTGGAAYSLTPNLRFNASYQGNYATAEHAHSWNMGVTFRFATSTGVLLRPIVAASKTDASGARVTSTSSSGSTTRNAASAGPKRRHAIDADEAYKNNCMRCHTGLPQYSPRMSKTILMHMRVDGNIPGDEADAILEYLRGAD